MNKEPGPDIEPVMVFEQVSKSVWDLTRRETLEGLSFPARSADISDLARSHNWFIEYRGKARKFRDMDLTSAAKPHRVALRVVLTLSGHLNFERESQMVEALKETVQRLYQSEAASEIRMNMGIPPEESSDLEGK